MGAIQRLFLRSRRVVRGLSASGNHSGTTSCYVWALEPWSQGASESFKTTPWLYTTQ